MKEIFDEIIDENEDIIAVLKPNARKFWCFIGAVLFSSIIFFNALVILTVCAAYWTGDITDIWAVWLTVIITGAVSLFDILIVILFASLAYRKRYYAYSNKRILIRSGIIGVDFKVLEYKLLGAMTVNVNVIDKILGGKTGTIHFGSASSPIMGYGAGKVSAMNAFTFSHVEKPYQLLREIKKAICKEEK
jgi:membrane protein YdbS with pleckstrin-like domain